MSSGDKSLTETSGEVIESCENTSEKSLSVLPVESPEEADSSSTTIEKPVKSPKKKSSSGSSKKKQHSRKGSKKSSLTLPLNILSSFDTVEQRFISISSETVPIVEVTVYPSSCEIKRAFSGSFSQGRVELIFSNLPASAIAESFRASTTSEVITILEVLQYEVPEEVSINDRLKQLRDEKADLERRQCKKTTDRACLIKKKNLCKGFLSRVAELPLKSDEILVPFVSDENVNNLVSLLERFNRILTDTSAQIKTITKDLEEVAKKIRDYDVAIGLINGNSGPKIRHRKEALVSIFAPSTTGALPIYLSYIIPGASWMPSYDVRIESEKGKLEVSYFGVVQQSSEEDWKNVKLNLSTNSPALQGTPPQLESCVLDFERLQLLCPSKNVVDYKKLKRSTSSSMFRQEDGAERDQQMPSPAMSVLVSSVKHSITSSVFSVPKQSSIKNDNKPHKCTIAILPFDGQFNYIVTPSISSQFFLEVKTINNSNFPFLLGRANVFFNNNFVVTSEVKDVMPLEELTFSVGSDDALKLEQPPKKVFTEHTGMLSKSRVDTIEQLFTIKCQGSNTVTAIVHHQIPKSEDEKIRVKLIEPTQSPIASIDEHTSVITWKIELNPQSQVRLPFKYQLEYPKDKQVEFYE